MEEHAVFGEAKAQLSPLYFKHINIQETANQESFLLRLANHIPCTFGHTANMWICTGPFDNLSKMHGLLCSVYKAYSESVQQEALAQSAKKNDSNAQEQGSASPIQQTITEAGGTDDVEAENEQTDSDSADEAKNESTKDSASVTEVTPVSESESSKESSNSPPRIEPRNVNENEADCGEIATEESCTTDNELKSPVANTALKNTSQNLSDTPALRDKSTKDTKTGKQSSSRQPQTCSLCSKTFSTSSNLFRHMKVFHQGKRFSCNMCDKQFTCKESKERHVRVDHQQLKCQTCNIIFTSSSELRSHSCGGSDGGKRCEQCGKTYSSLGNLNKHVKTAHQGLVFPCDLCTQHLRSKHLLVQHLRQVHQVHRCQRPGCTYTCTSSEDYATHMTDDHGGADISVASAEVKEAYKQKVLKRAQRQKKPVSCDQCHKTFSSQSNLGKHVRTVHQQSRHKCAHCAQTFVSKVHFTQHLQQEHGDALHTCEECGCGFPQRGALARHQQVVHQQAPESACQCSQCGRVFLTLGNLRVHVKQQHNGGSHACTQCSRTFDSERRLEQHERVEHQGHRYSCAHCSKLFKHKYKLKEHEIAAHTQLKPHSCEECGEEFGRRSALAYHTQRAHGHRLSAAYQGLVNPSIARSNWPASTAAITTDQDGRPLQAVMASLQPVTADQLTALASKNETKARKAEKTKGAVNEAKLNAGGQGKHNYALNELHGPPSEPPSTSQLEGPYMQQGQAATSLLWQPPSQHTVEPSLQICGQGEPSSLPGLHFTSPVPGPDSLNQDIHAHSVFTH